MHVDSNITSVAGLLHHSRVAGGTALAPVALGDNINGDGAGDGTYGFHVDHGTTVGVIRDGAMGFCILGLAAGAVGFPTGDFSLMLSSGSGTVILEYRRREKYL